MEVVTYYLLPRRNEESQRQPVDFRPGLRVNDLTVTQNVQCIHYDSG